MALHVNHGPLSGEISASAASPDKEKRDNTWLLAILVLCSLFEFACIHFEHTKLAVFLVLSLTAILGSVIIAHRHGFKLLFALTLYTVITLLFSMGYLLGIPIVRWFSIATVFLVPIIYALSKISFSPIFFPAKIPLILIVAGFVMSWLYQVCNGKPSAFGQAAIYDVYFAAGIAVFYAFYFLLSIKSLTLVSIFRGISLAGIPFILMVFIEYGKLGGITAVFRERLGYSIPFGPNFISSFLELLLPLALFMGFSEQRRFKRTFFLCMSALYALGIIACYSRGSLPGFFCLGLFLIVAVKSIKMRIFFIAIIVISLTIFGVGYFNRLLHPNYLDFMSNAGRVELFKTAMKVLQDNQYIFGIGMNSFSLAKFQFGFPAGFDFLGAMSSHNQYLELWMGWGAAALCGWTILVFGTMFRLMRIKLPREKSLLRFGVLFSLIFFMTHGIVDSVIASPEIMFFVFIILSCGQHLIRQDTLLPKEDQAPQ
jgi:O-antigen ligase